MRGYDDQSYGDAFADVYDDWYADISDVGATTAALAALADGGSVLELGVGTGRLALPLAATGVDVHGIDSSEAMLARLAAKPGAGAVRIVHGDMVDDLPPGPFALVYVAYNTIFGLLTEERQQACFHAIATRLGSGGCFAIEAFVPETETESESSSSEPSSSVPSSSVPISSITVRSVHADRVVLSVNVADPANQRADGQYIDITESGGVRLRPWSIRWATPVQLDGMAHLAGFELAARWSSFDGAPFGPESTRHVSVYRML